MVGPRAKMEERRGLGRAGWPATEKWEVMDRGRGEGNWAGVFWAGKWERAVGLFPMDVFFLFFCIYFFINKTS